MIPIQSGVRVWIATGYADMRKGMHSRARQIWHGGRHDPLNGDLFVFRGRKGDLVKIVWHDGLVGRFMPSGWSAAGSSGP